MALTKDRRALLNRTEYWGGVRRENFRGRRTKMLGRKERTRPMGEGLVSSVDPLSYWVE